jgi:uncharacterized protein YfbU (UPF0304 family)
MNKFIILIFMIHLSSCGKVEHKVSGDASVRSESAVWVSYKKMYEEWISICKDSYDEESKEFEKCKKAAVDNLSKVILGTNV